MTKQLADTAAFQGRPESEKGRFPLVLTTTSKESVNRLPPTQIPIRKKKTDRVYTLSACNFKKFATT